MLSQASRSSFAVFRPWRQVGLIQCRTATKKAVGSTKNGRDSNAQYLGVKTFGNEWVKPGNILVRQRGTKFHPGANVYMGKDHTLHSSVYGHVRFHMGVIRTNKMYVAVDPIDLDPAVIHDLRYQRNSWTKRD